MIDYYKKHVFELVNKIRQINDNPTNLDVLIETQLYILERIRATERRKSRYQVLARTLRGRLRKDRLAKEDATLLKDKIAHLQRCDNDCQWLLYLWRCFGDAIAFSYLNKWAIKPFLYNDKTPDVKQTAGHITGKDGFYRELDIVLGVNKNGVPALLNDLTNTIRHGDVCILNASDPYVIEVKSSTNVNQRVERQVDSIKNIHSYLKNDEAENLRGLGYCRRMEISGEEVNYIELVNQMLADAIQNGYSKSTPEPGVHYIVLNSQYKLDYTTMLDGISQPVAYLLNQAKNAQSWGCYYPFTLSIKKPELLYAFLQDDVSIFVIFDILELNKVTFQKGFSFTFNEKNDWTYDFKEITSEISEPFTIKMSSHIVSRIAFEFLSWEWLITEIIRIAEVRKVSELPKIPIQ